MEDINKSWDTIKYEYNLTDKEKFRWLQLVHAIPKLWLETLKKDFGLSVNLAIYDHNLIKTSVVHPIQVGKQGIIQYFTLLNVRKSYITKLL